MLLKRGQSGMVDFHAYSEAITGLVFDGKTPEKKGKGKSSGAKRAAPTPPPQSALDALRAMTPAHVIEANMGASE